MKWYGTRQKWYLILVPLIIIFNCAILFEVLIRSDINLSHFELAAVNKMWPSGILCSEKPFSVFYSNLKFDQKFLVKNKPFTKWNKLNIVYYRIHYYVY
jgi:hypothetical protein